MSKLHGKIALIPGGSTGIGLATAEQFLVEGAVHIYITSWRQDALEQFNKQNVTAMQGDVSKLDDLNKIYERIKKESDHLDILFVNAGVIKDSQLDSITEENFDYMFNINCKGVPFTVQKALPIFKGSGAIVLNASISSMVRV